MATRYEKVVRTYEAFLRVTWHHDVVVVSVKDDTQGNRVTFELGQTWLEWPIGFDENVTFSAPLLAEQRKLNMEADGFRVTRLPWEDTSCPHILAIKTLTFSRKLRK